MGRFGGATSGAASGAQLGSMIMPGWGTAIGGIAGGIAGAFGGGMSEQEKLAMQAYKEQLARERQFWDLAQQKMTQSQNYFAPIAGGSRTAALEAMAPEIQQGTERIGAATQAQGNLAPRSGGAAAMTNPWMKADYMNQSLFKMRPMAVGQVQEAANTYGSWAGGQRGGAGGLLDIQRQRDLQAQAQGASFYEIMKQFGPQIGGDIRGMFGKKAGGAGSTPKVYTDVSKEIEGNPMIANRQRPTLPWQL